MSKIDDQNTVRVRDADQHQNSHQRHYIQSTVRERQDDEHTDKSHRYGKHDQEGIDERFELRRQNQEQQNKRNQKAQPKALERGFHTLHHSAQIHADVTRGARLGENVTNGAGDASQVLAVGGNVDIDRPLNLIVVHFGRRQDLFDVHNVFENGDRPARSSACPRRAGSSGPRRAARTAAHVRSVGRIPQRNLSQVEQVVNGRIPMFEELHSEVVIVPALAIDPIIRSDHVVGIERGDHVVHNIFLCQA